MGKRLFNIYEFGGKNLTIGSSPISTVFIDEKQLPLKICEIVKVRNEAFLFLSKNEGADKAGINLGICVNGLEIDGRGYDKKKIEYGDIIEISHVRIIWLHPYVMVRYEDERVTIRLKIIDPEALAKGYRKGREINDNEKSIIKALPRNIKIINQDPIEIEPPPAKHQGQKQSVVMLIGPTLTMSIPMLIGFLLMFLSSKKSGNGNGSYMYMGLVTALGSALIGSIWSIAGYRNRIKDERINERKRRKSYLQYIYKKEEEIRSRIREIENSMHQNYPSLTLNSMSDRRVLGIWNRLKNDEDLYHIRIGEGIIEMPVKIEIPKERYSEERDDLIDLPRKIYEKYKYIKNVPICIDLKENEALGIISNDEEMVLLLFRAIALQMAFSLNCEQLRLFFCFNGQIVKKDEFNWIKWIPHILSKEGFLFSGTQDRARKLMIYLEETGNKSQKIPIVSKENNMHTVIFTDDNKIADSLYNIYSDTTIIFLGVNYDNLPRNCRSVVTRGPQFSGWINMTPSGQFRREAHLDVISGDKAEIFARKLRSYGEIRDMDEDEFPDMVTICELLGNECLNPEIISNNWNENHSDKDLSIEIGMVSKNKKYYLDLHENHSGPHGLVAGMTGSGKSEILQSIIVALAYYYSPNDVGFFLIDYKGGGMSNLFKKLPHMLGSISNLSGNMIYRAMVSVKSENERRQRLFLKADVNNINDYQRMYYSDKTMEPLPHIFIIIDEFAELKREEGDFMKEIISVAQVGRSLGVHLILATQKPSGTVDENIFSNARFRICLRVLDKQDSNEMLHKPDAAWITKPGRAYLQVGNDEIYQQFQGAYTMARSMVNQNSDAVIALDEDGRKKVRKRKKASSDDQARPQINLLIDAICSAFDNSLEKGHRPSMLFKEPLPSVISYESANRISIDNNKDEVVNMWKDWEYNIPVLVYDNPKHQEQGIYYINIIEGGHHIICGVPRSGKSAFLQTILFSFHEKETPNTLEIIIIDYSNGSLNSFRNSYMVAAYATEGEEKNINMMFYFLKEKVAERRSLFKGTNYKSEKESGSDIPLILLMIDNYGLFRERTEGEYDQIIAEIAKTGESLGIIIIITGLNISNGEIPNRLADYFKTGLALAMNDRFQYQEILKYSGSVVNVPDSMPGRGLCIKDGEILEFQAIIAYGEPDDGKRSKKLKKYVEAFNTRYMDIKREVVPTIPEVLSVKRFFEDIRNRKTEVSMLTGIPYGYDMESGKLAMIPCHSEKVMIVAGRKKVGKTGSILLIEKVAWEFGIGIDHVNSLEELMTSIKNRTSQIYIINDFAKIAGEYDSENNGVKADDLDKYDCMEALNRTSHLYVFEIREDDIYKNSVAEYLPYIKENCFGIYLGGALDKQRLFDFSYLKYSVQSELKKAGIGIVNMPGEYAGCQEIIIPNVYENFGEEK